MELPDRNLVSPEFQQYAKDVDWSHACGETLLRRLRWEHRAVTPFSRFLGRLGDVLGTAGEDESEDFRLTESQVGPVDRTLRAHVHKAARKSHTSVTEVGGALVSVVAGARGKRREFILSSLGSDPSGDSLMDALSYAELREAVRLVITDNVKDYRRKDGPDVYAVGLVESMNAYVIDTGDGEIDSADVWESILRDKQGEGRTAPRSPLDPKETAAERERLRPMTVTEAREHAAYRLTAEGRESRAYAGMDPLDILVAEEDARVALRTYRGRRSARARREAEQWFPGASQGVVTESSEDIFQDLHENPVFRTGVIGDGDGVVTTTMVGTGAACRAAPTLRFVEPTYEYGTDGEAFESLAALIDHYGGKVLRGKGTKGWTYARCPNCWPLHPRSHASAGISASGYAYHCFRCDVWLIGPVAFVAWITSTDDERARSELQAVLGYVPAERACTPDDDDREDDPGPIAGITHRSIFDVFPMSAPDEAIPAR